MTFVIEALIAAGAAIALWALSRVPGFTVEARLISALERDLKVLEKLPDGTSRERFAALVDARVQELLTLREPSPARRFSRSELRQANRLRRRYASDLMLVRLAAVFATALSVVVFVVQLPDQGAGNTVVLTELAAVLLSIAALFLVVRAVLQHRNRDR